MIKKIYSIDEANKLNIDQVQELYKKYINPNQASIFSSLPYGKDTFRSAEGMYLYTDSGEKILDFTGGQGVLGLGHNHPKIINARINFQKKNEIEIHKIIFSRYIAALAASLASLLPDELNKSYFLNSGAEAVEAAIKMAYKSLNGQKKNILHSDKSYHGKLIGSGSLSGSNKKNIFPKMENCNSFRFNDPIDLENKILDCEGKGGTYAVIVEPYSASLLESCSIEFMEKLMQLKIKFNFNVIFDEVFCGFFKSKKMFYFENFKNIVPEIICFSKVFGGGKSSISAVVANERVYKKAYGNLSDAFLHTTTFNGFAEESVTALETLNIMSEISFKENVEKLSNSLSKKLNDLKNKHPDKIELIKGNGILNGIIFKSYMNSIGNLLEKFPVEFIKNKSFFLKKLTATAISSELYAGHKILAQISDSSNSNHLSVSPSLIANEENIEYFFESLDRVLNKDLNLSSIKILLDFAKSRL